MSETFYKGMFSNIFKPRSLLKDTKQVRIGSIGGRMKEFGRVGTGVDRWMNVIWPARSYDWGNSDTLTSFVVIFGII